ncbi:hypothetical protein F0L17_14625 [Streptomyces sp. TRM43335]|uniref:Uncharacterized protein n=1 Tax=Streptomyces taklimakanensis TaxID=2569853 RepID=A0A6G2BDK0_9ACTN|nr:hypothetical protein [Streptomyces taklimakanensis]MTE20320.1 hypothetical protein [Streptomyces taklimakanensis]
MTAHPTPSTPEEPAGGPLGAEQPAPAPEFEPARPGASDGRTATSPTPLEEPTMTDHDALPAVPCLDWGLDRPHDAHTWTAPGGETARCPGWMPGDGTRPEPAAAEPVCCCGEPSTPHVVHRTDGPCDAGHWFDGAENVCARCGISHTEWQAAGAPVCPVYQAIVEDGQKGPTAPADEDRRQQYARALGGFLPAGAPLIDAVMAVADAETAQLRQQLADARAEIDWMKRFVAASSEPGHAVRLAALREAALDRVRALHQPVEYRGHAICAHCSGWGGDSTDNIPELHPCATIRALDTDRSRS